MKQYDEKNYRAFDEPPDYEDREIDYLWAEHVRREEQKEKESKKNERNKR